MSRDDRRVDQVPVQFRRHTHAETPAILAQSTVKALFIQIGDAVGLMVNGDELLTREEKCALIRAARALPTRD